MKKITTNQWLIGAGVIALVYILYKKNKDAVVDVLQEEPIKEEPIKEEPVKEEPVKQEPTKIDITDIPKSCLNGFDLSGASYYIKDNKFIKE
jgi:hypothetical protein